MTQSVLKTPRGILSVLSDSIVFPVGQFQAHRTDRFIQPLYSYQQPYVQEVLQELEAFSGLSLTTSSKINCPSLKVLSVANSLIRGL